MLKQSALSLLLLSLVFAGCIGSSASSDDGLGIQPEEDGTGPIYWERAIENTAYLLRVEAKADVTVTKSIPAWPENNFHSIFSFVGEVPNIHARRDQAPVAAVQDHVIENPLPQYTPPNPPESEQTHGPGEHYIVLDSKGTETTFTVESDNAALEVLTIDPSMSDYRWSYDDEWDYHLRLHVKGGRGILDASTGIPLHHNYTLTFMSVDGDPWEIDVDPVCFIEKPGYPHGADWWWIVNDGPIELDAKAYPGIAGAFLWFYTLDLPLDLGENGCWLHEDWNGLDS